MKKNKTTVKLLMCMTALVGQVTTALSGTDVYVGNANDPDCDYSSIQAAIDDNAQYTRINVSSGTANNRIVYNEDLTINRQLVIHGGSEYCKAPVFIDSPMVYLQGTGNGPVITIDNANLIDMYKVEISGGHGNIGGGVKSSNSGLRLINSFVHSNSTNSLGGGIYFENTDINSQNKFSLLDTKVVSNSAVLGAGGVYCKNGKMLADEFAGVSFNQTTHNSSDGGGIYLNNCDLDFYGSIDKQPNPINLETYRGISHNTAARHGGGIFALYSAVSMLGSHYNFGATGDYGWAGAPVNINNNVADSDDDNNGSGGGIYIVGGFLNPSSLEIHRGKVAYNSARKGGGLYIGENTSLKIQRTRDSNLLQGDGDCWSNECSVMIQNTSTFQGGAIFAENGTSILVSQTHLYENRSDNGSVLFVDSTGSSNNINFDQNLIYHNGHDGTGGFPDTYIIDLYNNSDIVSNNNLSMTIMHNTITDNHATEAVFAINGVNTSLKVFSSILYDQSSNRIGDLFGAFNSAEFDCVNVNETSSIGVSYSTLTRMNADNPGFYIRNYDYHIKPDSSMIDYCDNSNIGSMSVTNDIDDHTRAVDDPSIFDFYGAWDLGADENGYGLDGNDVIFVDAFDW